MTKIRTNTAVLGAVLALGVGGVVAPIAANAQTPVHKHSFLHRHRNAASAVAGVAAYKMAKHHGHGFMHRHPYLTGAAAMAATHHYAKKHQ